MIGGFGGRIAGGQRKIGIGAVVALVLLLLAWAFVIDRGGEERAEVRAEVVDENDASTTTTESTAPEATTTSVADTSTTTGSDTSTTAALETTAPPPPPNAVSEPAPSASSAPSTSVASTTTTEPCLDSFEERCGAFRWASAHAVNQPVTLDAEQVTERAVVGKRVEFWMELTDPDAIPYGLEFERGRITDPDYTCHRIHADRAYGPWNPPRPTPGHEVTEAFFTFDQPGTHIVSVCVASTSWGGGRVGGWQTTRRFCPGDASRPLAFGWQCHDPFGNMIIREIEVEVYPA